MADEGRWYTVMWMAQVRAPTALAAMTGVTAVTQVTARVLDGRVDPGQHCASCDGHACPPGGLM